MIIITKVANTILNIFVLRDFTTPLYTYKLIFRQKSAGYPEASSAADHTAELTGQSFRYRLSNRFVIESIIMVSPIQRIDEYFAKRAWTKEPGPGKLRALQTRAFRLALITIRGFLEEQLALRAMSLVYITLLTIVPLLAVSFSVLKAFGVDTKLLIILYYFLEPLGQSGVYLSMKIIEFVGNVRASILGSIGLVMLIYTVISTVQRMERSLNYVWLVKEARPFLSGISVYITVLLIGPVLVFSALGITASLMSSAIIRKLSSYEVFGVMFYFIGKIVPYVLICTAATFTYLSLPNTKVHFRAALAGGIAAGIMWQTTGWIFASFVATSAQYSAIYSGFAVLILFLIWLYWSFLILLVGAKVSFCSQYPGLVGLTGQKLNLDSRLRERAALTIMYLIGYNFYHGERPLSYDSISVRAGFPPDLVHEVFLALKSNGLIVSSDDEPAALLPARNIGSIKLSEVVDSVRMSGSAPYAVGDGYHSLGGVDRIMTGIDNAMKMAIENETVENLVLANEEHGG